MVFIFYMQNVQHALWCKDGREKKTSQEVLSDKWLNESTNKKSSYTNFG